ncbi:CopG family transcriptional regulator [Sulfurimonas sp.]|uniref:CopG family transcriptional regulator n=1 Tax=Sulfurimonas sp. TaxID=2022749 RepID=UPI0025D7281C|nr:CopG family transcriptional regulator [Sulfurimonas sp.]
MKTLTMRVDDSVYQLFAMVAQGQKRNISNFIEFATMQYLTSSQYVDGSEMADILMDKELISNLRSGLEDAKSGKFTIV